MDECEVCTGPPMAGVLAGYDSPDAVKACDECRTYDGDLDAALALAVQVGGVVRFQTGVEVRTLSSSGAAVDDEVLPGTYPWVEIDGRVVDWAHYARILGARPVTEPITGDAWDLWQTLTCGAVAPWLLNGRGRAAAQVLIERGLARFGGGQDVEDSWLRAVAA